jgi:uncharacterized protein (TIGR03790 family)
MKQFWVLLTSACAFVVSCADNNSASYTGLSKASPLKTAAPSHSDNAEAALPEKVSAKAENASADVGSGSTLLVEVPTNSPTPSNVSVEKERPPNTPTPLKEISAPSRSLTVAGGPKIILPKVGLEPSDLAVIVNDNDPQSVAVGEYYKTKRGIPNENMIHVQMAVSENISATEFAKVRSTILSATPTSVQAYATTWLQPWKVGGKMSVTSAIAFGFDSAWSSAGSTIPKSSPLHGRNRNGNIDSFYFRLDGKDFNYAALGGRPTMALAGTSKEKVFALIDRGVESDGTRPSGTAYLIETNDLGRNSRAGDFDAFNKSWSGDRGLVVNYLPFSLSGGVIKNRNDVLFYQTGLSSVPDITTNTYLPGAVTDNLSSLGGVLTNSSQMNALQWIEAGSTGSYGIISESYGTTQKFPTASQMVPWYFMGRTLIESYWSAVEFPGEGIFVGEPLASPFKGANVSFSKNVLSVTASWLFPNVKYLVECAASEAGPFTIVQRDIASAQIGMFTVVIPDATQPVYRIRRQ